VRFTKKDKKERPSFQLDKPKKKKKGTKKKKKEGNQKTKAQNYEKENLENKKEGRE
jgi:hypothetical protein